jgi:hypothetical protein
VSRRLLVPLGLVLVALAAGSIGFSRASFTTSSQTQVRATTAHVHDWLNIYSSSTDVDGDGASYAHQYGSATVYAATGKDENVAVNLGIWKVTTVQTFNYAFKVKSVAAYPVGGVTTVTATVTLGADPTTGKQPITGFGLMPWGTTTAGNTTTQSIAGWTTSLKKQMNLRVQFKSGGGWAAGVTYRPTLTILLTYSGFTTTYYQYVVPISCTYGP